MCLPTLGEMSTFNADTVSGGPVLSDRADRWVKDHYRKHWITADFSAFDQSVPKLLEQYLAEVRAGRDRLWRSLALAKNSGFPYLQKPRRRQGRFVEVSANMTSNPGWNKPVEEITMERIRANFRIAGSMVDIVEEEHTLLCSIKSCKYSKWTTKGGFAVEPHGEPHWKCLIACDIRCLWRLSLLVLDKEIDI
jgi:hypothetical protein